MQAQPVAGDLGHQPRLAVDELQRAFRAALHAEAAAVAAFLVDTDDLAFHGVLRNPASGVWADASLTFIKPCEACDAGRL